MSIKFLKDITFCNVMYAAGVVRENTEFQPGVITWFIFNKVAEEYKEEEESKKPVKKK